MRFRKRLRLFPGVHATVSKGGVSLNVGVPGLSVTLSKGGAHLNVGVPGTGVYDRIPLKDRRSRKSDAADGADSGSGRAADGSAADGGSRRP